MMNIYILLCFVSRIISTNISTDVSTNISTNISTDVSTNISTNISTDVSSQYLFSGAGITINIYNLNHGVLVMNCSTYDDCYNLLCMPMMPDDYLIVIIPNYWKSDCDKLDTNYTNVLHAEIDAFIDRKLYNWYVADTISDASVLFCKLNKIKNITRIEYWGLPC